MNYAKKSGDLEQKGERGGPVHKELGTPRDGCRRIERLKVTKKVSSEDGPGRRKRSRRVIVDSAAVKFPKDM